MTDQLDTPLKGRKKSASAPARLRRFDPFGLPLARIAFSLLAIVLVAIVARLVLVDDPQGGRPSAEVGISTTSGNNQVARNVATEDLPPAPAPADARPDSPLDGDSAMGNSAGLRALTEFGVLPDLVEETQTGPIPRIAPNGDTPFAAYARASITPASAGSKPLIAVVVTGMGLSEAGTLDAIAKLPDNVTLAFVPYGRTLQRTTSAARAEGHEMLLELPLEPFDYPENDPGPQTLLTGQPPRANLDRLFWLFSRMGGYVGVINHMGARFTASATDFNPVMEEFALRGLGYVDDGTSNRSLAANLAQTNKVPFARGDLEIDAVPSRAAILAQLEKLEAKAIAEGRAIGIASALPVSIQTIAEWAAGLEERNIALVPASALMKGAS